MARSDRFCTVDGVELHYSEWGNPDAETVVCVHGLTRVGRDFDPLARALEDEYHVVCPDAPGRGLSEWSEDGSTYAFGTMADLFVGFCDELGLDSLRWVGTSMGGGLGIALAGGALADRITHLVVNDVSPDPAAHADPETLERIVEYASAPPTFDTVTELEAYYRDCYATFSPMTDAEWRRFTVTSARRTDDGGVTCGYDPRVARALSVPDGDVGPNPEAWAVWESIDAETLVVRGTASRLLPDTALEEMLDRRPETETLEVDCGHAPALNVPEQIDPVRALFAR